MLAVKGIYEDGEIKLLKPIKGIEKAELYIIVIPVGKAGNATNNPIVEVDNEQAMNQKNTKTNPKFLEEELLMIEGTKQAEGFIQSILSNDEEDVWNDL